MEKRKKKRKKKSVNLVPVFLATVPKVAKKVEEVASLVGKLYFDMVKDDKFIATFLDATGLKKKNADKIAIAKNTSEMAKLLKERNDREL